MCDEKALRYNEGKPKWSLVHYESIVPMIRVLEFGALKYAPDNWKKSMDLKEILNSIQRHLAKLMNGKLNSYIEIEINTIEPKGDKILAVIPTLNGVHLITKPFNLQKFKELYPLIDVHKNNPTLLYYEKN